MIGDGRIALHEQRHLIRLFSTAYARWVVFAALAPGGCEITLYYVIVVNLAGRLLMRYNEVEVERVRGLLAETELLQRGFYSKAEIVVE